MLQCRAIHLITVWCSLLYHIGGQYTILQLCTIHYITVCCKSLPHKAMKYTISKLSTLHFNTSSQNGALHNIYLCEIHYIAVRGNILHHSMVQWNTSLDGEINTSQYVAVNSQLTGSFLSISDSNQLNCSAITIQ